MNTADSFNDEETKQRAEVGSRLRGLRTVYDHNEQLISLWKQYARAADQLRREYRGKPEQVEPGMIANWITARGLAENALLRLRDEQVSLADHISQIVGQLKMQLDS
jgi:hypothetical protein